MSLLVSKNDTPEYNYLSIDGAMTSPASLHVHIDSSGDPEQQISESLELYLIGTYEEENNIGEYKNIILNPYSNQEGLTIEISEDDSNYSETIELNDMNVYESDYVKTIYIRAVGDNTSETLLSTGIYNAEFKINATQHEPIT